MSLVHCAQRGLLAAALLWPLVSTGPAAATPPRDHDAFLLGGVQVRERDSQAWVEALRQIGMNTVAATVYARQGAWDGDGLDFDPPDPGIVAEIRAAKRAGLHVVLVLRVAVDHSLPENRFIWHGMIMPKNDELIRSWFVRYGEFAGQWAAVCETLGVDVLGIGSELTALNETLPINRYGDLKNYYGWAWYQRALRNRGERYAAQLDPRHWSLHGQRPGEGVDEFLDARFRSNMAWAAQVYLRSEDRRLRRINRRRALINDRWIALIGDVRRIFSGKLTYAANFDSYRNVGFWPWLDLIGINAYFPLRRDLDERLDEHDKRELFTESWDRIFLRIERFKRRQGLRRLPVVFTELGYRFRRHSTLEPWAQSGFSVVGWKGAERRLVIWDEQPVDYDERRLALEALHATHRTRGRDLAGLLYWKLSTDKRHESVEPFVLHVGPDSTDPSQAALLDFLRERDAPAISAP